MAEDIQIMCIRKTNRTNPHERIQGVGGILPNGERWYLPLDKAIAGVENLQWHFGTTGGGKSVWVEIATHQGHKYLKTQADGVHPDNLLSLPECP